ncbi:hypothetical protein [Paenibacillus sp. GYB003]|uniref:hypothetical protein n=1 Tax=Paenibacillus sp. GYB003 TaxID=2994392 RepID=UPI002F96D205
MNGTPIEQLFHISAKGADNPDCSVRAIDLLEREPMLGLLTRYGEMMKAHGLELAVSFFGVGLFGLVAANHWAMSRCGRLPDLSLVQLTVQLEVRDYGGQFVFKLGDAAWTDLPENRREAFVEEAWVRYFQEQLNPLVESAASAAGLKSGLIWNQYGSTAAFYMDYIRETVPAGEELERCEADFAILRGLPGSVFNRRSNPFRHTPRYAPNPFQPDKPIMIRSACCMYDKRENGTKCYYCPIVSDSERAGLLAQYGAGGWASKT